MNSTNTTESTKNSETPLDLRKSVEGFVSRAVDSVKHYNGEEYDLNRHNWVQITTDRVLAAIVQSLPQPVDTMNKYETDKQAGIFINLDPTDDRHNNHQLEHLRNFSEDVGWNKFYVTYVEYLKNLYNLPTPMIQSEHEQRESIHREGQGDSPDDKEPSQVR